MRIPLLSLAGLPLLSAFGINLFVIPFSSLVGAVSHRRNISKAIALYMVAGGTLCSITGAFLAGLIPPPMICWHRGNIVWAPALFVLTGSMIGARIGSRVSLKTKPQWLEVGLSIFVVILALVVVYRAVK